MANPGHNPNEFDHDNAGAGAGVDPRPRRRTLNPPIDEVIQSGEIVEPRSRIVRSSSNLARVYVDESDEATEITGVPIAPSRPTTPWRSPQVLWLAGALAFGIAAGILSLAQTPMDTTPDVAALRSDGDELVKTLELEVHAGRLRVDSIAATPRLVAAIETDEATIADLVNDKREHLFVPAAGEVLEIFQLRDGKQAPLFHVPAAAAAIAPISGTDARIEHVGDQLTVSVGAPIATPGGGLGGALALRHPIDLTAVRKRIAEHALAAKLIGIGAPIVLASSERSGTSVEVPVASDRELKTGALKLAAVIAPTNSGRALRVARNSCAGLAGLLVMMFGASLVRKRR